MATQTSNLGLTKPAYSETADIADINNNMDKVDAAVHGVQNGMAILANGNVHSAVTSGQYVYVRNHGTLAEGLYTATTNISTNATLSTSNLTAVPNNGALNTLRDDVTSLNSNLNKQTFAWSNYQAGVRSLPVNLPKEILTGQAQLVIVRHFRDNNVSLVDLILIFDAIGTKGFSVILKNSESNVNLESVDWNGTQATLTYNVNVYASAYAITLVR